MSGFTNRTTLLWIGDGHTNGYSLQLRQRGQATIQLNLAPDDDYDPAIGTPVYLFDQSEDEGFTQVFSGLIQDREVKWVGTDGQRYMTLTAVSLEAVFDTVYASPVQYQNQTCGAIVTDLFNTFEVGSQVTLGTIEDGETIPLLNTNYEKLSDLFDQLATTSGFIWTVDPETQQLYFGPATTVPAPFTLDDNVVQWDSLDWKETGADKRNRQAVRLSYDAFPHSKEFFVGAGQTQITLSRPVRQVTNAWATLSTCNTATGTFTGQPSPGDTITIQIPSGSGFGWQANHVYGLGGYIVDAAGFVQKVTTAGTSGSSQPTFSDITGNTTVDNTVIWTCMGPLGLSNGAYTYTFVSALDNTQYGQVLIGASLAASIQNLADAINATITRAGVQLRGVTYSLPTWENGLVNAITVTGTTFVAQQKSAGSGWISALSETSASFSWSSSVTTGGTSPQGSLGPGYGATLELQVYQQGTSTAAPGLSYLEGSAVVNLATPLNVGSNLNVEYTREDGNVIEVENTALVTAEAALTHGTGKLQQITDVSSQGLISVSAAAGLQFAQESLAAFETAPEYVTVQIYRAGIRPGMLATVNLTKPTGSGTLVNGEWIVEEVTAEMLAVEETGLKDTLGHYRYTLRMVSTAVIGSYMDFWKGLGGGSGGSSGGGSGLVATSGGGTTNVTPNPSGGALTPRVITASYTVLPSDAGTLFVVEDTSPHTAVTITMPATAPATVWNIGVQNASSYDVTIARNGRTIDGNSANLTLHNAQGVQLYSDGTNYFTERGMDTPPDAALIPVVITASVTLTSADGGTLQVAEDASPHTAITVSLPATAPQAPWMVGIQNASSFNITVSRNGHTIDGATSNITLQPAQGIQIFCDGSQYFTERGVGGTSISLQTNGVANGSQSLLNLKNGANITITDDGVGGVSIAGAAGGGNLTKIASVTTSGSQATVTFSSIAGSYSALIIEYQCRSTAAVSTAGLNMKINSDATAANYTATAYMLGGGGAGQGTVASSTSGSFINNIPGSSVTAGYTSAGSIRINAYALTTFFKRFVHDGGYSQTGNADIIINDTAQWLSTAAINRFDFVLSSGNFVDGSTFVLYGEG